MRLLATLDNPDRAKDFSTLLNERKIAHQIESQSSSNWGDENYGVSKYLIWIVEEEAFDQAWLLWGQFSENPDIEAFRLKPAPKTKVEKPSRKPGEKIIPLFPDEASEAGPRPIAKKPAAFFTRWLILICTIVFFLELSSTKNPSASNSILYIPSPISQSLLYDFPKSAEIYTKVMSVWGSNDPQSDPKTLPKEAQILLRESQNTPYWRGFYDQIVAYFRGEPLPTEKAPLFEKIGQGELWRLFSPIFLHGGLLHILFNMMWLWVLGVEIEKIVTPSRYLWLILALAVFSCTAQYLMSGFNFLGFSGVVSGLAFFTAERQKRAPWEGYRLQRPVFIFLVAYIFGLAGIQTLSFLMEIAGYSGLPGMIGNTAHVGGALAGWLLGKTSLFSWKA